MGSKSLHDDDFPEPPRLRRLRRLVTALTATLIAGVITIVGLLVIRLSAAAPPLALPPEIRAPRGRDRRGGHPRPRLGRRRHPRRRRPGARPRPRRRHRRGARRGADRDRRLKRKAGPRVGPPSTTKGERHPCPDRIFIEAYDIAKSLGLPTGAKHLYLVYRENGTGAEYVMRAGTDGRPVCSAQRWTSRSTCRWPARRTPRRRHPRSARSTALTFPA